MNRLSRRDIFALVSGFVVGLLIGMILVGSSDDLRTSLFGTASEKGEKTESMEYYLVDLETTQQWLTDRFPDNTEKLQASMSVLTRLPAVTIAPVDFKAAEEDIKFVLPYAYAALVNEKDPQKLQASPEDNLFACLGVDDDPYQGTAMYLYLTIPTERAKKLDIPKDWEKLDSPKTNVLYWKLVACYPELPSK
jgi:hypothetical protein